MMTWMDLEGILLCEISQRKTNILLSHTWNLKKTNKQTHRKRDQTCGYQRQRVGENGIGER